ncbi:MAG: hypothetical protein A3F09_02640 [Chlamydiae bacterium RIFCSPHIGHO2_12_FULL_49_11]|nr:MAG: hypothetical protein A3F09_02640 [Chlamydiae bacterium RIFCSPHIGHO2_12_FULL_49_11]
MKELQELVISAQAMRQFPCEVLQLSRLTVLSLQHTRIAVLPEGLSELPLLNVVCLAFNRLRALSEDFGKLPLIELELQNNPFTEVPLAVARLTKLEKLNLSRIACSDLSDRLQSLTNLQVAYLSGMGLKTLPELPGSLEELDLSQNNLGEKGLWTRLVSYIQGEEIVRQLSSEIGKLINLRKLNLSFNSLRDVPDTLGQCDQLLVLDLSSNRLSRVPDVLSKMARLVKLSLAHNPISTFCGPVEIGGYLTSLDLTGCGLSQVEIGKLKNLAELFLGENCLAQLPVGMEFTAEIKILDLHGNRLTVFPDKPLWLNRLEYLDLSANRLVQIDPCIQAGHNLRALNLSYNPFLEALPNELGNLPELRKLVISPWVVDRIPKLSENVELVVDRSVLPGELEGYLES